jgi:hypothetical protein
LRTANDQYRLEYTNIHHPWPGPSSVRVVIGDVILRDRKDKAVEAFTFGGSLQISNEEEYTHCTLTSPVPIIDLQDEQLETQMLANETQALIARRRVDWEHDLENFEQRISKANVGELFYAVLKSLEQRYSSFPKNESLNVLPFHHFLHKQIDLVPDYLGLTNLPSQLETII